MLAPEKLTNIVFKINCALLTKSRVPKSPGIWLLTDGAKRTANAVIVVVAAVAPVGKATLASEYV